MMHQVKNQILKNAFIKRLGHWSRVEIPVVPKIITKISNQVEFPVCHQINKQIWRFSKFSH